MWSWTTNVTGRRRDGRTTCNRNNVLCTSASRGKKSTFIKHVRMYYGSGTVCMREVTLSARNDVMAAAVSKLWGQIENPTPPMVGIYWGGRIVPNFIPISLETTEPWAFWKGLLQEEEEAAAQKRRRWRWILIWDQLYLIQKRISYICYNASRVWVFLWEPEPLPFIFEFVA